MCADRLLSALLSLRLHWEEVEEAELAADEAVAVAEVTVTTTEEASTKEVVIEVELVEEEASSVEVVVEASVEEEVEVSVEEVDVSEPEGQNVCV